MISSSVCLIFNTLKPDFLSNHCTNQYIQLMKTTFTQHMMVFLFLLGGFGSAAFSQLIKENGNNNAHPNFTYIDNFEISVDLWWTPEGSGSTAGIILQDPDGNPITYRAHETGIVNPHTGSTGSMRLAIAWDNEEEYIGTPSHLVRQHMPAGTADTPERRFQPGQALEVFIYGDGSGNRFRFMTRDGIPTLEGSPWYTIDWTGWKRITWDYNQDENVVGWVNGDGVMDGENFYFDSFQITKDPEGTATGALLFFDDLRIVDPFHVSFDIAQADGNEVISINHEFYDAGTTDFVLFPGDYQYFVHKEGYLTQTGFFEVDEEDVVVEVSMEEGSDPEYEVTFTVMDPDGDLIPDAEITLGGVTYPAGEYVFEFGPGFYSYTVSRQVYYDALGQFTVVDDNVFVNVVMEEVPDLYDRVVLTWYVASTASTPQYREEHYSVWVAAYDSHPGEEMDLDDFEMVFSETLSAGIANWALQQRSIELSAFSQQYIRIAFRHHDSTDKDRIVIDNVELEGRGRRTGEGPDMRFWEGFAGGLPDDFDPADEEHDIDDEWLPEGWMAIDANGDGFNWYFAVRVEQDLSYRTHMRSQSWDSAAGEPLTPDNWLIVPVVEMPLVLFYDVVFSVEDDEGNPIDDAVITLDGVEYEAGHYVFSLTNNTYDYMVSMDGHETVAGSFTVDGEDKLVEVVLPVIPLYVVTFEVNLTYHEDFVAGETDIFITGNFPDWQWAEPGTYLEQQMDPTDNIFIFTKTLHLPEGSYVYKYFDGPSFGDGEWPGDPNREVEVEGDMEVADWFGFQTDPTDLPKAEIAEFSLFPNPAGDYVVVESDSPLLGLSIYNLQGQRVYSRKLSGHSARIALDDLMPGLYLLQLESAHGHTTSKLQVLR